MRLIKGIITSVTDGDYQKIVNGIGRPGEEIVNRSYFQHVGFTSWPPADSVGIFIADGDNVTMVASADPSANRPSLSNEKDVAIYADANKFVKINAGGEIEAGNNNNSIYIRANGDIELGTGIVEKLMKDSIIAKYNAHTHVAPVGGSTGPPSALFLTTDATTRVKGE